MKDFRSHGILWPCGPIFDKNGNCLTPRGQRSFPGSRALLFLSATRQVASRVRAQLDEAVERTKAFAARYAVGRDGSIPVDSLPN